jgi:NAD(P)-dependent dehydrogenase (short-subunit alcohol dehydrogenase family)
MDSRAVVLITGSSTGFGRLIAERLAREGYTVFATMREVTGRNAKNAAEIGSLAQKHSLPLQVLELDVTDHQSVERAVGAAVEEAGRIDVAINNAGYGLFGVTEAVTTEQAQRNMDVNFFGAVRVNRAVLPHMRRQRSGLLLHISSGAGRLVIPGFAFYCASKFALEVLGEAYHYELAAQGIESVIVEPGAYQTAVFSNIVMAADQQRTHTYGAVNQIGPKIGAALSAGAGDPEEVVDAVLRIIETPRGQRQLRYRVSRASLGVDEINAACERVQQSLLDVFELTADTRYVPQKNVGST